MKLIEQLGGYEKAKEVLKQKHPLHNINALRSALLDYRRANNIFEYGDDVVCVHESSRYELYVIHGSVVDGMVWIRNHRNQFIHERAEYLKHATDKEIEVGHRLP